MTSIPLPSEDVTDEIQAVLDHGKGRRPFDALLAFCGLDSVPNISALRIAAEETLQESILETLIGTA